MVDDDQLAFGGGETHLVVVAFAVVEALLGPACLGGRGDLVPRIEGKRQVREIARAAGIRRHADWTSLNISTWITRIKADFQD